MHFLPTSLCQYTHIHTCLTALCLGVPGWAGTRKVKPIWILLKQETVSGSGISWDICKSAPRSRQITMPAPHHSVFYTPDALPAAQPTVSKHWRHSLSIQHVSYFDASLQLYHLFLISPSTHYMNPSVTITPHIYPIPFLSQPAEVPTRSPARFHCISV